ncbi:aspartate/glutamate racemase family protein [Candidatus Saccharibacteria bacterium]|nr:aspartate/glutamate racemase family protein [Candidatus Saccharibacteria bacterium]
MKRIGIIGGMSYESTLHYYEEINRQVNERAGRLISADLILRSVNFEEYHELMESGDWQKIDDKLSREALGLVHLGKCDFVAIATNTMHKVADHVGGLLLLPSDMALRMDIPEDIPLVDIPLIHIGDSIAEKCKEVGAKRVLLLGTKFTMTEDFLKKRLAEHKIETIDLSRHSKDADEIDRIIFQELCRGVVTDESADFLVDFIRKFPTDSEPEPDAIILGCTELDMLIKSESIMGQRKKIPIIDSTKAHIESIVKHCLSD